MIETERFHRRSGHRRGTVALTAMAISLVPFCGIASADPGDNGSAASAMGEAPHSGSITCPEGGHAGGVYHRLPPGTPRGPLPWFPGPPTGSSGGSNAGSSFTGSLAGPPDYLARFDFSQPEGEYGIYC